MRDFYDFMMRILVLAFILFEIIRWSAEPLSQASLLQVILFVGGLGISLFVVLEMLRYECEEFDRKRRYKKGKKRKNLTLANYDLGKEQEHERL